jgi:hypothetical protein
MKVWKKQKGLTAIETEYAARALYAFAGWDRPWREITPEGRRRWREAVRVVVGEIGKRRRIR